MLFDSYHCFKPQDFVFKIAETRLELEGYWALRRAIFCEEQGIFRESDWDTVDECAIPIVCESLVAGMEDLVVGVVRIDEREPGVWYGSRLGVAQEFSQYEKVEPRRGRTQSSASLSRPRCSRSWSDLQGRINRARTWLPGISRHGSTSERALFPATPLGADGRTRAIWLDPYKDARGPELLSAGGICLLIRDGC